MLGTVKDTLLFVCCEVCPTGECDKMHVQFSARCLFSHRYVGIGRIRPGTVFSSTVYVASVLRRPRTCRRVGLCSVDCALFYAIIAHEFVRDVRYTYPKHTCFR